MKIPEARERALRESLEMLVDLGRVCLRRRRMQAAGGSKSEEVVEVEVDFEVDFVAGTVVEFDVDCSVIAGVAA